jgi:phosphotransferase system  glucose/maltose/N-acetylglucosamine-specific IIC component
MKKLLFILSFLAFLGTTTFAQKATGDAKETTTKQTIAKPATDAKQVQPETIDNALPIVKPTEKAQNTEGVATVKQADIDSPLKDKLNTIALVVSFLVTFLVARFKESKLITWLGSTSQRITVVTSLLSLLVLCVIAGFNADSISLLIESLKMLDWAAILTFVPTGTIAAQGFYDKALKSKKKN